MDNDLALLGQRLRKLRLCARSFAWCGMLDLKQQKKTSRLMTGTGTVEIEVYFFKKKAITGKLKTVLASRPD